MIKMSQLAGKRAYAKNKKGEYKRYGKIHFLVFSEDGKRVVGAMVKRPDVAGMAQRDDEFFPLSALHGISQGISINLDSPKDKDAVKELGLDFDKCIMWGGMDVKCENDKEIGHISDVSFDSSTGDCSIFCVGDGEVSKGLVGLVEIEASNIVGYRDSFMIVNDSVADKLPDGGVAARAGVAYAKGKESTKEVVDKAKKTVSKAVSKGTYSLGKMIGDTKRQFMAGFTGEEEIPPRDIHVE